MKKIAAVLLCFGGVVLAAQAPQVPVQVFEVTGTAAVAGVAADRAQSRDVRVRFDVLETAARGARRVALPLPAGDIVVRLDDFLPQAGGFFAKGPVVDAPGGQVIDGEATFTVIDEILVARIVHGDRLFMMRRVGESAIHRLTEIDLQAMPAELMPRTARQDGTTAEARTADALVGGDSNALVDVLVVYTPAAKVAIGGTPNMQAEIVGAVNNANAALEASGLSSRFRLVHQTEVTYTEAGDIDLDRLTDLGDGFLDEVHQLRDFYRADIVSLVGTSNACGVGWVLQNNSLATQSLGFNVNHWTCINGNLTMAHEIGHNMGLQHDRKNATFQGSSVYAYGYRIPGARDVMAYGCHLPTSAPEAYSCEPRRTIFSTPTRNFSGTSVPAGVANSEDNTRALSDTFPTVANFRDSTCSYTLASTRTTFGASGGSATMTMTTGPTCAWAAVSGNSAIATLTGTQTRVGSGSFNLGVSTWTETTSRSTQIYAGGQSITIQQTGPCEPTVVFSATTFPRTGGTGTATVTFPSGCGSTPWTASSSESFLGISSGASGTGNGTVSFGLNTSTVFSPRTAVLTVAGLGTTITQTGTTMTPSPTTLQFGATKAGTDGALVAVTEPQKVTLLHDGGYSSEWTATANQSWLQVTNGSGVNSGTFTVGVVNPGNIIGAATSLSGSITVTASMTGNSPITIPVTLTVQYTTAPGATTQAPFGSFDTPAQGASVAGSIAVTGWALDDVGIDRVEIWRDRITNDPAPAFLQNGHPANGKVFVAQTTFVEGTRPDVEQIYTSYPARHRAGWGYLLLTWGFPNANGTFVLTAVAWDEEGQPTVLGTKTITVNNATSTKPFGSIDVPGYGATFSGANWTYGWALTPAPGCTMSGGQRYMTIDSAPPYFDITYGSNRTDIGAAFPGFADSNGAGGAAVLNSPHYTNGTHQIGWLVYDSCGNGEGIGSRFFTILNGGARPAADAASPRLVTGTGPAFPRVGERLSEAPPRSHDPLWLVRGIDTMETAITSDATVWLSQTGRVEVHVTRPGIAPAPGLRYEAYLAAGGTLRALPIGSSFDTARGSFYWQPVAGFLGEFTLHVIALRGDVPESAWTVPIVVSPGVDDLLLQIDGAVTEGGRLRLHGWALDPLATDGSGVGRVHVWTGSTFLGEATLDVPRPDVGDWYGRQFGASGYSLRLPVLPEGEHDLVVYAWSLRTARWEAARAIRIQVPPR